MKKLYPFNPILLMFLSCLLNVNKVFGQFLPNHSVGTITGKYAFSYNQTPDQLVEIVTPIVPGTTVSYQWESSTTPGFEPGTITILGSQISYTFSSGTFLGQTTYYRRRTTIIATGKFVYSNVIKLELVSVNWENINYVREHDVLKNNINTDWKTVDQLLIGDKLQTTTYLDGLGRPVQQVSKETATPDGGTSLWGDIVQFSEYDLYGREPFKYLPYTKAGGVDAGKYKTAAKTDQPVYFTSVYNETNAYSSIAFDNSPLNRVKTIKSPGTSWAAGQGNSTDYELNTLSDDVKIFRVGPVPGDIPYVDGVYAANTLFETVSTDENGKKVVEYSNKSGQLVLRKVQSGATPTSSHSGWFCTYNVYDDFGLLRYVLQPKAVLYLLNNGAWSFSGTSGPEVLAELCFRYDYDEKGRTVLKKAPGAQPLRMLYDDRDRVVFMQDGNQAAKPTPEWTVNLYDELDRIVITAIYATNKTISQLQADIDNAVAVSSTTMTNSGEAIENLILDTRDISITSYKARTSISFVSDAGGDFSSGTNDNFTAEIDPAATTPVITTSIVTYKSPVSSADLNNAAITTILKYQYYDDYSFTTKKTFDAGFDNNMAYSNTNDPNVISIAWSTRTLSYPTGSMVRVLGTNTFLTATEYYDEKGRHIQTIESNIKNGQDVTTKQYHFDGRLLSIHSKHSTSNSGYSNFGILTKNLFDKIGRVVSVQKKYGANTFKTVASYDYDDIGRLKVKHLDPGYTGSGKAEMESLTYSYNIQNNITGINKDYALKTAGKYDKWGNFFGLYLGYDNKDGVFNTPNLDGHVTGILWNTQGDDAQRKYDFAYDHSGRLVNATFTQRQKTSDTWDNSKMDFSVTGPGGNITYDANGNLLTMLQKGVLPGATTPIEVDNLSYVYSTPTISYTNKLYKVKDLTTQTATNGQMGDFSDGTSGNNTDYAYDDNGNLLSDKNKNITNIKYNYLDKPETITITGKGVLKIIYDAEGNKLQKQFTPNGTTTAVVTTYINQYVYKGNDLQFINFEEGRIRAITPVSVTNGFDAVIIDGNMDLPAGKEGVYDFYIRDYQENVRMILTEEVHTGSNKCTMENDRASAEEPIFGQTGSANEVAATRIVKPTGWSSNTSATVSKVGNLAASKTGPNSLLKVMAGDLITATTEYYIQNLVTNTTGNSLTTPVLNTLIATLSGSGATSSLVKGGSAGINTQLAADPLFIGKTAPHANSANNNKPKAYLTILFFDERFNFIDENSTYLRVNTRGNGAAPLVLPDVKAPKNGYAFIYVSNENDEPVYFDNFNVQLNRGRIIEEDHYYAYGLKIAGISSQKYADPNEGNIDNKYLYNDKEVFDEADVDWYDYGFRNYDAQIGRFVEIDPLAWDFLFNSPFDYAIDDPIRFVDVYGLGPGQTVEQSLAAALIETGSNAKDVLENVVVTGLTKTVAKRSMKSSFKSFMRSTGKMAKKALQQTAKFGKRALEDGGSFALGAMNAYTSDHLFGQGLVDAEKNGMTDEKGMFFQVGQKIGHLHAAVSGLVELFGEGAGEVLSLGTATVPIVAASAVSVSAVGNGAYHLFGDNIVYAKSATSGNNTPAKYGKEAHKQYSPGSSYKTKPNQTRLQDGSIPDAVDEENHIVRELKPNNSNAYQRGVNQVKRYLRQLEKQTGKKWKYAVDTYDVNPNGTFTYHLGDVKTP